MTKTVPLINSEFLTTEEVECVVHLFLPASVHKKKEKYYKLCMHIATQLMSCLYSRQLMYYNSTHAD